MKRQQTIEMCNSCIKSCTINGHSFPMGKFRPQAI